MRPRKNMVVARKIYVATKDERESENTRDLKKEREKLYDYKLKSNDNNRK